jgi:hypothetical protein
MFTSPIKMGIKRKTGFRINEGLVGHWPLEEGGGTTTADLVNSNTGSLIGPPSWSSSAKIGARCLDFTPTDRVTVPRDSAFEPNNVTVSCWVNLDTITPAHGNSQLIINKKQTGAGHSSYSFLHVYNTNELRFYCGNGGAEYFATITPPSLVGSWINVIGTYDGNNVQIYANGIAGTPNGSMSGNIAYGAYDLHFGHLDGNAWDLDGRLDDVRIWDRAFTAGEAKCIYNRGN